MTDKNEPRRVPAKKPGESKPSAASMKERLLAERRAAEAAGAKQPAAKPAAKPDARPAGAKPAGAKPAGARPASAGATPRAARAPRAEGEHRSHRRVPHEPKKMNPLVIVAAIVVLAGGGYGVFFLMQQQDAATNPAKAAETADSNTGSGDSTSAPDAGAADPTTDGVADATGGAADSSSTGAGAATPDEALTPADVATLNETKGSLPNARDEDSWNTIAINKDPNVKNDPNSVDLSKLRPYPKPSDMDSAEWDSLVEDARLFFDLGSGAKGKRAEGRLEAAGLNAWPVIMNEFIKIDPKRIDDNVLGMSAQRLLDRIRGTTTGAFDWRTPDVSGTELERRDLFYNMQLIVELHDVWRRHLASPDRYFREKIAKGTVKEEMDGNAPKAGDELDVENLDLGDLGDLGGG